MNFKDRFGRYWQSFSYVGLVFATLLFAVSVAPSLLPRHYVAQGLLSGLAIAIGYGLGNSFGWLWRWLELPHPTGQALTTTKLITTCSSACVFVWFLWRVTAWQNSIRVLMEMPPIASSYPFRMAIIALVVGATLITLFRWILWTNTYLYGKLTRVLPRKLALAASVGLLGFTLLLLVNDLLAKSLLTAADAIFLKLDHIVEAGVERPEDPLITGSQESLVPWDGIGRWGKTFVVGGPAKDEISEFLGEKAKTPLRVYVGLRADDAHRERAELALAELKRVGAFDRKLLVVATPTGTGWIDPNAVDTLEYLHGGDTAIVSMQYSYLPSWITLLVDPERPRKSARMLFETIYAHWKTLPKAKRPKLYLQGLSLGSLGSELSAQMFTIFEDPIQGALWSGPPFASSSWAALTAARNADSPAWLPTFGDGSIVRFTNQQNTLDEPDRRWGPIRCVYIQNASDPMIFFSPNLLWSKPEWLEGERGPDVSPYLDWYPIVTFLQIAFDLPMATSVPMGYGHNYAPANYIEGWVAVTAPENWTEDDTQRLKQKFAEPR